MFFSFFYLSIYPIYTILSYPILSYPTLSYPIYLYIYTSIHLLYLLSISLDPPSTLRHIISPRHKYHIPVVQGEAQGVGICICTTHSVALVFTELHRKTTERSNASLYIYN
jgi:hypothetical protein